MYGPGETATAVAEYQAQNPTTYVVWRNCDGFIRECGRYINDYFSAEAYAKLEAEQNTASYFAHAWVEVDGVVIFKKTDAPLGGYKGD